VTLHQVESASKVSVLKVYPVVRREGVSVGTMSPVRRVSFLLVLSHLLRGVPGLQTELLTNSTPKTPGTLTSKYFLSYRCLDSVET
jgi:hypothetical protein